VTYQALNQIRTVTKFVVIVSGLKLNLLMHKGFHASSTKRGTADGRNARACECAIDNERKSLN
jgi:hypothetical protein